MPTPYGTRGGMAFGAGELRVLRRALALALHPSSATVQDVQDCHRLAESVDDAARESARFRAFLLADLARYRTALPGTAGGYVALLRDALDAEYRPEPADFAALRALPGNPAAVALLKRCRAVVTEVRPPRHIDRAPLPAARAERAPGAAQGPHGAPAGPPHEHRGTPLGAPDGTPLGTPHGAPLPRPVAAVPPPLAVVPSSRRRLLALPGGRAPHAPYPAGASGAAEPSRPDGPREPSGAPGTESEPDQEEGEAPEPEHVPEPEPEPAQPEPEPGPAGPATPGRPVPTPAEVFPPKRKPAPPQDSSSAAAGRCAPRLAAG